MSFTIWTPAAVSSEARRWRGSAWRMVESQHIAATMKLVDTREEQDLLETLLDRSKPSLSTPFRYPPRAGGSRFRSAADPGVFHAAESVRTAAAELGYWRWRFLRDAVDLDALEPVPHTVFAASLLAVSQRAVTWRREAEAMTFSVETWQDGGRRPPH